MLKLFLVLVLSSLAMGKLTTTLKQQRISGAAGFHANQATFGINGAAVEAENSEDIFEINQKLSDLHLIGGDMAPSKQGFNAIVDTTKYWPNARIPIALSSSLNSLALSGIEDARQEYEMKTCITLPYRESSDSNYVYIDSQGGCWSYVGVQGGGQTLSIGSGCEKVGIVIHELMHAAGVQHEQCRTDRDGYISVEEQNISPSYLYNFDKYTYNQIDDHRVPYDYYSVMHYSDTSFSYNGQKSIVTHDPQFQDVIGQREGFSEGDAALLNRMYSCAEPKRVSSSCNFEEDTICGFVQGDSDDSDWFKYSLDQPNTRAAIPNAPLTDSTYANQKEGNFMIYDATLSGTKGYLKSMRFRSNNAEQCLEFSYYIQAKVDSGVGVYLATIDQLNGEIISTKEISTLTGNFGSSWNTERITMTAPEYYRIVFAAKSGSVSSDIIAIDDLNVVDKACDSTYFVLHDFSQLLDNTEPGSYIESPVLYSEEGYGFTVQLYPQGRETLEQDRGVGVYLAMAEGKNDATLQWPMHNRVVKVSIVDQNSNVLKRINVEKSFLTSDLVGNWNKPTTRISSPYGWSKFMSLAKLRSKRNYLKHDSIMISVNVRNMENFAEAHANAFA